MRNAGAYSSGGEKPDTPTVGTPSAGNGSASVPYTAPAYIGKDTISYIATSSPGSITGTGSSSPITVSGLSNGTAYTFSVQGLTSYGVYSDQSSSSSSVTPVAPPSFPPYFPPPTFVVPPYFPPPPSFYIPPYFPPSFGPSFYFSPSFGPYFPNFRN